MAAFDFWHIQEAGGAADQDAAREGQLGDRLKAAFVDRPRAVGDASEKKDKKKDGS